MCVSFDVIYVNHAPLLIKWALLLTLEWLMVTEAQGLIGMRMTVSKAFVSLTTYQWQACPCPLFLMLLGSMTL